jgi:hypothetical protein
MSHVGGLDHDNRQTLSDHFPITDMITPTFNPPTSLKQLREHGVNLVKAKMLKAIGRKDGPGSLV